MMADSLPYKVTASISVAVFSKQNINGMGCQAQRNIAAFAGIGYKI